MVTASLAQARERFWFKEFIEHRDPHLLGPPLRPDPQSYSALSDYAFHLYIGTALMI